MTVHIVIFSEIIRHIAECVSAILSVVIIGLFLRKDTGQIPSDKLI